LILKDGYVAKKNPKTGRGCSLQQINDLGLIAWDVVLRRASRSAETRELCVVIYRDSLPWAVLHVKRKIGGQIGACGPELAQLGWEE